MARALVALILTAPWCLAVLAWCAGRMRRRAWAADYTTSPPAAIATPEPVGAVVEPVPARNANRDWRTRLTPREMEVLRLMATARTNRAIARELGVSEETVRSHVKRVLHKLDQPDRTQAVLAAVRNGLLDLQ